MASVVGQASAAATSVAIPAHQAGDLILVFARGTAAAPTKPAAAGTVPAWDTLQSGLANACGLHAAAFVATAATTTTGTWTSATHICVLVLRPAAAKRLQTAAARSAVGNGNNTQTIIYPALTLIRTDGTSFGVRCGTRTVADSEVGTNVPAGWTNQTIQPAGASALMAVHIRAALAANPTADSVATAGTNAAYRAVTVEVEEINLVTNVSVGGVPSAGSFGGTGAFVAQQVTVNGFTPDTFIPSIVGGFLVGQALVGGSYSSASRFGVPTVEITYGTDVPVAGVPSAQAFGTVTAKGVFRVGPTALPSAQSFGTVTPKTTLTRAVTGLGSAQAFGTVTTKTVAARPVSAVPSAQAFGTVTIRTAVQRPVGGVSSAQAFGAISVGGVSAVAVLGVSSAQSFGTVTVQAVFRLGPTFVPSAQAFGAATISSRRTLLLVGLGSAQAFGAPTVGAITSASIPGLGSAQSFGTPTTRSRTYATVPGLGSAQQFGAPTTRNVFRVNVAGIPSAQSFGTARAGQIVQVPGLDHGVLFFHIVGTNLAGQAKVGWDGEYLFGRPAFGMQYVIPGLDSAQQFGTPHGRGGPVTVSVGGVGSAQAFGEPFAYRAWVFTPPLPDEIILAPVACASVTLAPVACADTLLVPVEWSEAPLTPSAEEDLILTPSVEE